MCAAPPFGPKPTSKKLRGVLRTGRGGRDDILYVRKSDLDIRRVCCESELLIHARARAGLLAVDSRSCA